MGIASRSVLAGVALLGLGFTTGAVAGDPAGKGIVRWTMADLKWQAMPGGPGMAAPAWSAPNGSHCDFIKFPKGTKVPLHTHTADISAVVLEGHFGSAEEGAAVKLRGSGSYQSVPGALKHTTECGGDADCVIFSCQAAAFDLVPAGGPNK